MHRATIAQQRVRMEGWRQERLGSRAGTHREEEKNKNILTRKKERKTYLTLTGLLMEGTLVSFSLENRELVGKPQRLQEELSQGRSH